MQMGMLSPGLALLSAAATVFAHAETKECPFTKRLPDFNLRDPAGTSHTRGVCRNGAVIIATAPTLKHGDRQREWQQTLKERFADWAPNGPALILLEDMTQSWFKSKALKKMREKYVSGKQPILLIDEQGAVRRALEAKKNALKNRTVVLVYDPDGKLVHWEREEVKAADVSKIIDLVKEMKTRASKTESAAREASLRSHVHFRP